MTEIITTIKKCISFVCSLGFFFGFVLGYTIMSIPFTDLSLSYKIICIFGLVNIIYHMGNIER